MTHVYVAADRIRSFMKRRQTHSLFILPVILVVLLSACHGQTKNTEAPDIEIRTDCAMLYIGNSFTYMGDVPGQIKAIAAMYGVEITYDQIVPGGAKLCETKDEAMIKIRDNEYDRAKRHGHLLIAALTWNYHDTHAIMGKTI